MKILMEKQGIGANQDPIGFPAITGTPRVGVKLTADTSGVSDPDSIVSGFSYQWNKDGTPISGATNSTYTPVSGDESSAITVTVSYLDGAGFTEYVTSSSVNISQYYTGGYIVETNGFQASNGSTITEIRTYNSSNAQLTLGLVESQFRDSYMAAGHATPLGQSWFGDGNFWGWPNLKDNNFNYTSNSTGIYSACLFNHYENGTTSWSRFRMTASAPPARFSFWVGSPEGRNARSIKVYGITGAYSSNQLTKGYNTGLELITSFTPTGYSVYRHDIYL